MQFLTSIKGCIKMDSIMNNVTRQELEIYSVEIKMNEYRDK